MKTVIATLKSVSPYSQSKKYDAEKQQGESHDDFYRRTWRGHLHTDDSGVFIPPMSLKNCVSEGAKFLSISVPGKGKSTYTKHFDAGILVVRPVHLGLKADAIECEKLFLPSDGRRGSGTRVNKYYPIIHSWSADAEFIIVDETVLQTMAGDKAKTVFQHVLEESGKYIGIGRFRPRNNGFYGRFSVEAVVVG
jgi:hypothetical protein